MAGPKKEAAALRKRQKIQDSNKMMFVWVAGASVLVGFALVISWFLWQQILFKGEIITEKNRTISTLQSNIAAVTADDGLRRNIRVLETNTALNDAKAERDQKALQVILDALPADGNSLALGASLQQQLAQGISGLTVESISVTPTGTEAPTDIDGIEYDDFDEEAGTSSTVDFRMTVSSANINSLRDLLTRFERSIRVINIDRLVMERSQTEYTMTLEAHAYYEPGKVIELTEKDI